MNKENSNNESQSKSSPDTMKALALFMHLSSEEQQETVGFINNIIKNRQKGDQ